MSANKFSANTSPQVVAFLKSIFTSLGVTSLDLSKSATFKATIESRDGNSINYKIVPTDQGFPYEGHTVIAEKLVEPSSGAATLDGAIGTATLVASSIVVTVPPPADGGPAVPAGSTIYATVTTPAGAVKQLSAVRTDDTSITISSPGVGFGALLDSAGTAATLVAGVNATIALANVAGDVLAVKEVASHGTAAAAFSVARVSNTLVKVQAEDAAGAAVATNTSDVKAYNFGQATDETSVVRWAVVRP